jgi:hypothetical protein
VEPTFREVTWTEAVFARVVDNRLAELVTVADQPILVSGPAYVGSVS